MILITKWMCCNSFLILNFLNNLFKNQLSLCWYWWLAVSFMFMIRSGQFLSNDSHLNCEWKACFYRHRWHWLVSFIKSNINEQVHCYDFNLKSHSILQIILRTVSLCLTVYDTLTSTASSSSSVFSSLTLVYHAGLVAPSQIGSRPDLGICLRRSFEGGEVREKCLYRLIPDTSTIMRHNLFWCVTLTKGFHRSWFYYYVLLGIYSSWWLFNFIQ